MNHDWIQEAAREIARQSFEAHFPHLEESAIAAIISHHLSGTEQSEPNSFDVFSHMCRTDNLALRMAPLSNIISARSTKLGTQVTIGVGGNVVGEILNGNSVGGLILCDKGAFNEVKRALSQTSDANKESK